MNRPDVVEDLVLTVINDGNGDQCGMNYQQRCNAADTGYLEFRKACKTYGTKGRKDLEMPEATRQEIIAAATLVQEYYRNHAAELLRDKKVGR